MKTAYLAQGIVALLLSLAAQCAMAQNIQVVYDGPTATVTIPSGVNDVTAQTDGAYVTLTSTTADREYTYTIQGSTTDGALTLVGAYKLTLLLDGADIASQRGPAIDVQCGKRIAVVLPDGTTSTLADAPGGTHKAAMNFTGHPEFEGAGTLNVTGRTKHAICAKEYLQIKKTLGTINILGAASDGIHCGREKVAEWDEDMALNEKEFFILNGGNVNISGCGGDCIDAGSYGCMLIKGGALNLDVTAHDVCAMKSANTLIMQGGQINIDITGQGSYGIYVNNQARLLGGELNIDVQGDGSKGIKAKLKASTGYTEGGNVTVDGTRVDIVARGADLATDPADPSHCVAASVDGDLLCDNRLSVTAVRDARGVTCDGTMTGEPHVTRSHWYASPHDYQYDMTIYATLEFEGTQVLPADVELAAFCGDECRGVAQPIPDAEGVYYLRVRSNTSSGEKLTFMAYDGTTELEAKTTKIVRFVSQKVFSTPASPLRLTATDTTPVTTVPPDVTPSVLYDLTGRRLPAATPSRLVITNGRKYIPPR